MGATGAAGDGDDTPADVLVIGGGPVGLTLAALLARLGVVATVIEADAGYCTGSRAICVSRRSQEIMGWLGADAALAAQGLPWVGGRSYYRNDEVLHFRMPTEAAERFAPMLNIQQHRVEALAHAALAPSQVRWATRLVALRQHASHVEADVQDDAGRVHMLRARWLVACDGGRSTVRDLLGLALNGTQYEGRYVIVDIEQASTRPVERLAWFDPPSNPGSTLLMHRQPGNVWRVDYQIADDEDAAEAVKPENVLPRVASHLQMIGETAPWQPQWISIYNAKCLSLDNYRHGRVLLAGDAAHLVPIFGVRGLNSGLDDAGNLAWKLAAVLGGAPDALLDSYSAERRHAALENMAYGAKSTEFMAPPDFAFALLRQATLRLARVDAAVRSLINPRQSAPVAYAGSVLNESDTEGDAWAAVAAPGTPAPEALLQRQGRPWHLTQGFGAGWVLLWFGGAAALPAGLLALRLDGALPVRVTAVRPPPAPGAPGLPDDLGASDASDASDADGADDAIHDAIHACTDTQRQAWQRYDAAPGTLYLIRPDGYVQARWRRPPWLHVQALLTRWAAPREPRAQSEFQAEPQPKPQTRSPLQETPHGSR